ncbi:MAG: hypothetical protein AAFX92_12395 [Pseudomonadota bacterium]
MNELTAGSQRNGGQAASGDDMKIFFVSAIAISAAIWDIGFNLGAFSTVFFDKLFLIWAVSTAAFLASLFVTPPAEVPPLVSWRGRFLLILPTVWLLLTALERAGLLPGLLPTVLWAISLLVGVISLPYTLYIVIVAVTPDLVAMKNRRLWTALVLVVAAVFAISLAIGYANQLFLDCADFRVSGNDLPPRCAQP